MRQMVSERIERFEYRWEERKKTTRFGFLIRPATIVVGLIVLVVGIITIPLPGQGWLTTFLGIGILSLEVSWAKDLLRWGVRVYDDFFAWYHRQSRAMRWSLIVLMLLVIWLTFMVLGWIFWGLGGLEWLDFLYGDWLGLERF